MQDPTKRIVKDQTGFKAEKSDYVLAKGPDGKRVWINKLTGEIREKPPGPDAAGTAQPPAPAAASSGYADNADQLKMQLQIQAQLQMQATMQDLANKFKAIDGSAPPDSALNAFRAASGSVAAMGPAAVTPAAMSPAAMLPPAVTPAAASTAAMTPAEMGQATMAMAQAAQNPAALTPAQMGQAAMAQAALCQSAMPPGLAAMNAVSNASVGLFTPPALNAMPEGLAAMMAAGEAAGLGPMPPGLAAMMAAGGIDVASMAQQAQQVAAPQFAPAAPPAKKITLAPELAARLGVPRPPAPSDSALLGTGPLIHSDSSKNLVSIPATAFQVLNPPPAPVQQFAADNRVVNTGKVRIVTGKVGGAPAGSDRLQQEMQRIQAGLASSGSDTTDAPFAGGEDNSMDLDYDLMAGTITQEDYDRKMAEMNPGAAALAAAAATNNTPDLSAMAGMDAGSLMAAMAAGMSENGGEVDGAALAQAMQAALNAGAVQPAGEGEHAANPADQAGMDVAMAAQMMQLNRFHMQQRVFETQKCIASGDMPTRFKEGFRPMQLCKQFVKSATCVRGETCSYAHTFEELHPMSPNLPGAQSAKAMEALEEEHMPEQPGPEPVMRMQRKRAMCQRLHRGGCLLGGKCPFAHNEAELGTVGLAITDRVKTHICKFFEQGKCVYGKYCVNAHGPNEIGKPKPEYLCPPSKANDPRDKEMERGRGPERDYGRDDREKRDRTRDRR